MMVSAPTGADIEHVLVGIGELAVARPPTILAALGLGSCVGLTLYDPVKQIGGLAHIMLPASPQPTRFPPSARFADQALALLMTRMLEAGAHRERLEAKIIGGARMFVSLTDQGIGQRNIKALRHLLHQQGIPLVATDVGGQWGRSIEFDLHTGLVRVRSFRHGEHLL